MRASSSLRRRAARLAALVAGALAFAACTEDVGSGAACPALCPTETLATRDTVLEAIVLDTTLAGYPGVGREGALTLAQRGDTLSTRVVVRFDTLSASYDSSGTTKPYTALTSATLILPVDSARTTAPGPLSVDVYDVDAGAADTAAAALLPLFRADRRVGGVTYASRAEMSDTLRVPLDPATVLARIRAGTRLRLGLQLRSPGGSGEVRIQATDIGSTAGARLRLRVPTDTVARDIVLSSRTPALPAGAADELRDFVLVQRAPGLPANTRLAAGGVYGRRVLMQFAVPPAILDSSTVVRATLELTQAPNRTGAEAARPLTIYAQPVTASVALADTLANGVLRDPVRVASFLCAPTKRESDGAVFCPTTNAASLASQYRLDSLVRAPRDSGTVRLEIGPLLRLWQIAGTPASARALVLRAPLAGGTTLESLAGGEVLVFSKEAAAGVRPRLRVTFVTRSSYALP